MANSSGWGDGAANNSIGWGQGANNEIGWGSSHATSWSGATDIVGLSTDSDAQAFLTASAITGATQKAAIDNLVKGLKQDGLWTKMKAVYPFVTDNRNLLSYTEDFSDTSWQKIRATITTNAINSPIGTLTADKIVEDTSTINSHAIIQSNTFSNGLFSIYVKAAERSMVALYGAGENKGVGFNLTNGTTFTVSGLVLSSAYSIESAGNGWYRISISNTSFTNTQVILLDNSGNINYTGNGTSGLYAWGAQLELGSTITTYQPQLASAQSAIASQFKYNLKDPRDLDAAFRLVFNGGWTHSSTGATPNGTNGYADTKLVPSSVLTQNSASMGIYSRTNNAGAFTDYGSYSAIGIWQRTRRADDTGGGYVNASDQYTANTSSLGLYSLSRISSSNFSFYKNGTPTLFTSTSTGIPNVSVYIGAGNLLATAIEYTNRQYAFQYMSDGLSDTEAANLYTRVQAFQTALSRQV